MSKVSQLQDFEPKGNHSFLIDTNILMYLQSPIASYNKVVQESIGRFISRCKSVDAHLNVTSLILGEFFHVNLNLYFDLWCKKMHINKADSSIKADFRGTEEFNDSVKEINSSIETILKFTTKHPDNFHAIDLNSIGSNCFHAEFTDSYLLELSNQNDWILVSNDKDLIQHPSRDVEIVTTIKDMVRAAKVAQAGNKSSSKGIF